MSRAEDRERLLAATLAHAQEQEAQYRLLPTARVRHGRWKTPAAISILAVAWIVAVSPPQWAQGPPLPRIDASSQDRGVRAALFLQAQQVEAFRVKVGSLPRDLSEVPVRVPGIVFIRSDNRVYQLVAQGSSGDHLVYDSARPAPDIEAVSRSWFEIPDPSS